MEMKEKIGISLMCVLSLVLMFFLASDTVYADIKTSKVEFDEGNKEILYGQWTELGVQRNTESTIVFDEMGVVYDGSRVTTKFHIFNNILTFKKGETNFKCRLKEASGTLKCEQSSIYNPDRVYPYQPEFAKRGFSKQQIWK